MSQILPYETRSTVPFVLITDSRGSRCQERGPRRSIPGADQQHPPDARGPRCRGTRPHACRPDQEVGPQGEHRLPGVRQGGEDAQAPPIHGTRSERHRLSRAVGAPSRLPDGVTELRCPAKRVGQEDRVGEEAEEAGTEEGVTAVSTSTPTLPRKKASACAGRGGSRREGT